MSYGCSSNPHRAKQNNLPGADRRPTYLKARITWGVLFFGFLDFLEKDQITTDYTSNAQNEPDSFPEFFCPSNIQTCLSAPFISKKPNRGPLALPKAQNTVRFVGNGK